MNIQKMRKDVVHRNKVDNKLKGSNKTVNLKIIDEWDLIEDEPETVQFGNYGNKNKNTKYSPFTLSSKPFVDNFD